MLLRSEQLASSFISCVKYVNVRLIVGVRSTFHLAEQTTVLHMKQAGNHRYIIRFAGIGTLLSCLCQVLCCLFETSSQLACSASWNCSSTVVCTDKRIDDAKAVILLLPRPVNPLPTPCVNACTPAQHFAWMKVHLPRHLPGIHVTCRNYDSMSYAH